MPLQPRRTPLFILATLLCSLTLFAGGGELIFRYVFKNYLYRHFDERNVLYRYDSELGWFPLERSEGTFSASRTVSVTHNSDGFRDTEHGPKDRPRIAVLGDSFVWGFDVEQTERFTDRLDSALTDWDVMNMGVSGYSTDQEYLLLRRFFDRYRPDIVLLVFCQINDEADNTTNMIFEGYFKPYYTIENGRLSLEGVPVQPSINYFYAQYYDWTASYLVRGLARTYHWLVDPDHIRVPDPTYEIVSELNTYVTSRGAQFIVGLQDENAELTRYMNEEGIDQLQLKNPHRYPAFGTHWTPAGHQEVSRRFLEYLSDGEYLIRTTQSEGHLQ